MFLLPTTRLEVWPYMFPNKTIFSQNSLTTFEFSITKEIFSANSHSLHVIFTYFPVSFFYYKSL